MILTLVLSIFIFYGLLIIVNIPASYIGLEFESKKTPRLWYAPPGYVIPVVWFLLFTLLGVARFTLIRDEHADFQWWLYGLALLCASYTYYTLGLSRLTGISALWFGLIGNIIVILFTAFVVWKFYFVSKTASYLTLPVVLWTIYASVIVIGEMKQEKLNLRGRTKLKTN